MTPHRLRWGLAALGGYLLAATLTSLWQGLTLRPLYDGLLPPPPYNWVDPPPGSAQGNRQPESGSAVIRFAGAGSTAKSVLTGDGQAQVSFPQGAFGSRPGARQIHVTVEPLDPARLDASPPPDNLSLDGNAYRVEATYEGTDQVVALVKRVGVVLRYPTHATVALRLDDGAWKRLSTTTIPASLAVVGRTDALGVFAAAGIPQPAARRGISPVLLAYLSAGAAALAVVLGLRTRRRLARERAARLRAQRKGQRSRKRR